MRGPKALAIDAQGNVYVADSKDHRIRRFSVGGNITTIAGTGVAGKGALGTKATETRLQGPSALVVDPQGRVVFADTENCRIVRIETDGTLRGVAGTGVCGQAVDGITATSSPIDYVNGLAYDSSGNLIFTDLLNSMVRKVSPAGVVSTVAGTGLYGYSGDLGPATAATLSFPEFLTVSTSGKIYFSDGPCLVRVIAQGVISTAAGTGTCGLSGDGAPAPQAKLEVITGLFVDAADNLLIASAVEVRRVTAGGIIDWYWGAGDLAFTGDGGPPSRADLNFPSGFVQDKEGNYYIADSGNHRIRRVTGGVIQTVAGGRTLLGDGGPAVQASIYGIISAATAPDRTIYFVDNDDWRVRKILPNGTIAAAAGSGVGGVPTGSLAVLGEKMYPRAVAVDAQGLAYVGTLDGIHRIEPTGFLKRIAGVREGFGPAGNNVQATTVMVFDVTGLAFDSANNLFVAEGQRHCVRKITPAGVITTVAGICGWSGGFRGDGGPAISALLDSPRGIAVDAAGALYISDYANFRIRKVDAAGVISTMAGTGRPIYNGDNIPARQANLSGPSQLVLDSRGNLFIAERFNGRVRQIAPDGTITTVAVSSAKESTQGSDLLERPAAVALHPGGLLIGDAATGRMVQVVPRVGPTCTYTVTPTVLDNLPATDGSGSFSVSTQSGCAWTSSSNQAWIGFRVPTSGTGSGTVAYVTEANPTTTSRVATLTIAGIAVTATQSAGTPVDPNAPVISANGVVNTASYQAGVTPGSYLTIYGRNFAPAGTVADWSSVIPAGSLTLPTVLAGVSVKIGGQDCHVYYVNADLGMITVLVPQGVAVGSSTMELRTSTGSVTANLTVTQRNPGFFAYTLGPNLYASALFANELVYVAAPGALGGVESRAAKAGDRIVLYANGLGGTATPIPVGEAFAPGVYFPIPDLSQVSVTVGGIPATVEFAGMTIAGVWQVNLLIPANVSSGDLTVVLRIGGQTTQPNAKLTFAATER